VNNRHDMDPFAYHASPSSTPHDESNMGANHHGEQDHQKMPAGLPFGAYVQSEPDGVTTDKDGAWISLSDSHSKSVVQGLYIGIFAIFGSLIRMLTAQFFGEECAKPGTVGWLASGSPLCVTSSGSVIEEGGIIFADLPANMFGSFIMGFFASCATLQLAVSTINIPWLPPTHPFQKMTILHKGITTGFCGSLTTFSGWNSSMVVLLFGTGSNRTTHVINALFGYIIGMEVAVGCYIAGKSLARRLYRVVNPILANESDAMVVRKEEGVYLNPELPDFERRFLPDLDMGYDGEKDYGEVVLGHRLEYLSQWRDSTKEVRRVNHPLLPALISIEKAILIDQTKVTPLDAESIAKTHGWNVSALREWARAKEMDHGRLPSISSNTSGTKFGTIPYEEESSFFQLAYPSAILAVIMTILLILLSSLVNQDAYTITDRTMVYAMICSPPGAIFRWLLSTYNGKLPFQDWSWFPLGTFLANVIGSILSITIIATEYRLDSSTSSFWVMGTMRAVKVGFVGSLTTVSTFVAEVHGFIINNSDHAYPYMLTTLVTCCSICSLIYGVITFGEGLPADDDANS